MAFTLGFHILLVPFGLCLPLFALIANARGLRHDDRGALRLARRWSQAMGVLFAVGAVTGTVLSFELGILWPGMLGRFGDVFGLPFAIEGIAFFLEAIFIAIYIFGWDRLPPRLHLWLGAPLPFFALLGAFSIISANSWMNTPRGFQLGPDGRPVDVHPWAAIFNPALRHELAHFILAALLCAGFAVASIYAVGMLRGRRDRLHRLGFLIPFSVAAIATPLQMLVGDTAVREIVKLQPIKFAAMEMVPRTAGHVPERLGGRMRDGVPTGGVPIPDLASFLTGFHADTRIVGLDTVPAADRPPATIVHLAFDVMVGSASALALLSVWFWLGWLRRRDLPRSRWFLRACAPAGLLAFAAMEAGWVLTEVGRQPWIVYGVLRTAAAVTHAPYLWASFAVAVAIYAVVGISALAVLRAMSRRWRAGDGVALPGPYAPRGPLVLPGPTPGAAEARVS
ncbi:MAG TPA: cytochrome ubiquinol oxidase subunit I [Polyangia bacterium]|nr:cytochrome ubiquinol oxidase subunit I [Polyangia bacterium]